MKTLKHTFMVLQCVGLWRPVHWLPGWKTNLYTSYTGIIVILAISIVMSELVELLSSIEDVESFANNSFLLLTLIADCGKAANILMHRNEIIDLTNALQKEPFRPSSEEELAIQRKFDRSVRFTTLRYGTLTGCTVIALVLRSFMQDIPRRTLPYKSWLPFEHQESFWGFWIAYIHQIVTLAVSATVNVRFDSLVPGLILQTCAQLNILKHRLKKMAHLSIENDRVLCSGNKSNSFVPNIEAKMISQRVEHHLEIFKFTKKYNDIFGIMIFAQYTVSTVVLCVSVFELSKMELFSAEFTSHMMYLTCMCTEIFIFCFYGCELTFEAVSVSDAIYEMDWLPLSIATKRSLLTIMVRARRPLQLTSFYIITLNLDSFTNLVKLSYSAYNVLQRKRV